jgi:hypothetical protein
MRLLKFLLTGVFAAVALLAGLFATMVVALTGALIMLFRRLLGGRRAPHAHAHRTLRRRPEPREQARGGDAIDVVATEVPAEPPAR